METIDVNVEQLAKEKRESYEIIKNGEDPKISPIEDFIYIKILFKCEHYEGREGSMLFRKKAIPSTDEELGREINKTICRKLCSCVYSIGHYIHYRKDDLWVVVIKEITHDPNKPHNKNK